MNVKLENIVVFHAISEKLSLASNQSKPYT